MYLCSTPYTAGLEHGVHPLDPAIGIAWPQEAEPTLSEKDAAAPLLGEAQRAGLLPVRATSRLKHAGGPSGSAVALPAFILLPGSPLREAEQARPIDRTPGSPVASGVPLRDMVDIASVRRAHPW
jgi:hypothetical protein